MVNQFINKFIFNIYSKLKSIIEQSKYDAFNMEDYFRKKGVQIGINNRIMIRDIGEAPFLIKIGNHCTITQEVTFLTHDGGGWIFTEEFPSIQKFGPIHILDNCFIGYRATILPNVTIGPNSIVGACSVVTKDVPPNIVVAGNPAIKICSINVYKEKLLSLWDRQEPPNYLKDLKKNIKYSPREIHNAKLRDFDLLKDHLIKLFSDN